MKIQLKVVLSADSDIKTNKVQYTQKIMYFLRSLLATNDISADTPHSHTSISVTNIDI